jgi:uncharacterized membrane protein YhhN
LSVGGDEPDDAAAGGARVTPAAWIAVAVGFPTQAALLASEVRDRPAARAAAKVACSIGFVVVALAGGVAGRYAALVLAGLVLSVAGDALLLSRARTAFLAGLVAFLLAHVAYAAAFAPLSSRPAWALAAVAATVAAVLAWLWRHLGEMRLPVVAYCAVIGTMLWLALGVPSPLVRAGALLFFLSDLLVARDRFVAPGKPNRLLGWPLYYAGQYLIALSAG